MTDRLIAEWQERPYVSHDRRGATVYHRIKLFVYNHGVDIEHQARGDAAAKLPDEWTAINVWEVRNGRVAKLDRRKVMRA
jgi:hypothetical protein